MLYKALICSLLVSAINCYVSTYSEADYKLAFTEWMIQHEKSYAHDEFQYRYQSFKTNMDKIAACNQNPEFTFTCGFNAFTDIPHEEFLRTYTGFKLSNETLLPPPRQFVELHPVDMVNVKAGGDIVNWADKGAVLPPKDQGQCGSCWSFSVTGALEALNQMYTGNLISLSEQNLMDCSQSHGTNGCGGGDPRGAFGYVIDNHGIDREANYPYEGRMDNCRFQAAWTGAAMGSIQAINQGDENDLTNHINQQVVAITVDVTDNFQHYSGGIFNDPTCGNAINQLDHAISAIGYGGNYYVVRNSWGTGWGANGYIYMSRNAGNQCGVATYATVPRP